MKKYKETEVDHWLALVKLVKAVPDYAQAGEGVNFPTFGIDEYVKCEVRVIHIIVSTFLFTLLIHLIYMAYLAGGRRQGHLRARAAMVLAAPGYHTPKRPIDYCWTKPLD